MENQEKRGSEDGKAAGLKEENGVNVGTVVSTLEGPSTNEFAFVINEKAGVMPVRRNQFVELDTPEGRLIGTVTNIAKTNRYFERAESVKEYERSGAPMNTIFPTERWEYIVAETKPLGVYSGDRLNRPNFPPSPGTKVYLAENQTLKKFLGIDEKGLELGKVEHHDLPVRLNMTRLVQKHIALLGISGSGKSVTASVLIEELLDRKKENGRPALLIVDTHGEYTGFAQPANRGESDYSDRTKVVKGDEVRIGVQNMNARAFADFLPEMSPVQQRDLDRILSALKSAKKAEGKQYHLENLIEAIEADEKIKDNTKQALVSWISDLRSMKLFNYSDYPPCTDMQAGKALILDLSDINYLRKKQMIVAYITRKLFNLRRNGLIPPFVEIIEEAHQFAPEGIRKEDALSKGIIETMAREGRKFHACLCLISQRPTQLSTTALSQANTHIILRVTNPYDLDHIGKSSEGITRDTLDTISSLRVGEGLIVGEAVNFPVFVRVRNRRSQLPPYSSTFEEEAAKYETVFEQKKADAKQYM